MLGPLPEAIRAYPINSPKRSLVPGPKRMIVSYAHYEITDIYSRIQFTLPPTLARTAASSRAVIPNLQLST
jgi:hypothetical protein